MPKIRILGLYFDHSNGFIYISLVVARFADPTQGGRPLDRVSLGWLCINIKEIILRKSAVATI